MKLEAKSTIQGVPHEKISTASIKPEALLVVQTLRDGGYEAYLVGGCVRDLIIVRMPKDWDVTTNATPEQIIPLFEKTFYENSFGTVGVVLNTEVIEVTPYRIESEYKDGRRPESVSFSTKIEDDLDGIRKAAA